jgi:hypothetical protein
MIENRLYSFFVDYQSAASQHVVQVDVRTGCKEEEAMPVRKHVKDYVGVWYRESTVPGKVPPKKDKVFYITFRRPGERVSRNEKVGRESEGWNPTKVSNSVGR